MAPGRDERKQEQQNGQGQGGIAYCHRVVSLCDNCGCTGAKCLLNRLTGFEHYATRCTHTGTLRRSAASRSPAATQTARTTCTGPTAC